MYDSNAGNQGQAQVPVGNYMERQAPLRESPPDDYRRLAIVSVFFCPLLGLLALFMSYVTIQRYENDEIKRAGDASRDAKFSAIMAIVFGVAIAFFCIFIFEIVPLMA